MLQMIKELDALENRSKTETTPWTTSSSGDLTDSSLHPSDTCYDVVSLESDVENSVTGKELTANEVEWLRLAKEYTGSEKAFVGAKKKYRIVRKMSIVAPPKRAFSWTLLRRKLNGREDVKNILATKGQEEAASEN